MGRVLPMPFIPEMVREILDERKTVTRRRIKPKQLSGIGCKLCPNNRPEDFLGLREFMLEPLRSMPDDKLISTIYKKPCKQGDILYVQEEWFYESHMEDLTAGKPDLPSGRYSSRYIYKADDSDYPVSVGVGGTGWRPSMHMPKEAARIWLKVTNVRVERLQDMDKIDAVKEGIDPRCCINLAHALTKSMKLWNSTIKKPDQDLYGWDANPWVWVIEFERCEKPESED